MGLARLEELRALFLRKKQNFIRGLGGVLADESLKDPEVSLRFFDGADKYRELADKGQLPAYCKILDNQNSGNERLRGDISSDLVYCFLLEAKEKVEEIADNQYERDFAKRIKLVESEDIYDPMDEDREVYVSGKANFIGNLIYFMEHRGKRKGMDTFDLSLLPSGIDKPERYEYLESLARSYFSGNIQEIDDFVEQCPAHQWEWFSWPCDCKDERAVSVVTKEKERVNGVPF